jgi:hypothetical protein
MQPAIADKIRAVYKTGVIIGSSQYGRLARTAGAGDIV